MNFGYALGLDSVKVEKIYHDELRRLGNMFHDCEKKFTQIFSIKTKTTNNYLTMLYNMLFESNQDQSSNIFVLHKTFSCKTYICSDTDKTIMPLSPKNPSHMVY